MDILKYIPYQNWEFWAVVVALVLGIPGLILAFQQRQKKEL